MTSVSARSAEEATGHAGVLAGGTRRDARRVGCVGSPGGRARAAVWGRARDRAGAPAPLAGDCSTRSPARNDSLTLLHPRAWTRAHGAPSLMVPLGEALGVLALRRHVPGALAQVMRREACVQCAHEVRPAQSLQ